MIRFSEAISQSVSQMFKEFYGKLIWSIVLQMVLQIALLLFDLVSPDEEEIVCYLTLFHHSQGTQNETETHTHTNPIFELFASILVFIR